MCLSNDSFCLSSLFILVKPEDAIVVRFLLQRCDNWQLDDTDHDDDGHPWKINHLDTPSILHPRSQSTLVVIVFFLDLPL